MIEVDGWLGVEVKELLPDVECEVEGEGWDREESTETDWRRAGVFKIEMAVLLLSSETLLLLFWGWLEEDGGGGAVWAVG